MPNKRRPLINGCYYHIFNRGVAKQRVFSDASDYQQAIFSFAYYRFNNPPIKFSSYKRLTIENKEKLLSDLEEGETLVDIIAYVLMPNHFHFLLKQNKEKGIATFISKFTNSYTKYFNLKRNNVGPIFQGVFKDVPIETDEQLLHVSRYIHLNPLVASIVKKENFFRYSYSSMQDYLRTKFPFVETSVILSHFASTEKYKEFVLDQESYGRELEFIKHHLLDD